MFKKGIAATILLISIAVLLSGCVGGSAARSWPITVREIQSGRPLKFRSFERPSGANEIVNQELRGWLRREKKCLIIWYGTNYSGPYLAARTFKADASLGIVVSEFLKQEQRPRVYFYIKLYGRAKEVEILADPTTREIWPNDLKSAEAERIVEPGDVIELGGLL